MNQQSQDFQDKVVLITGGTRGIGKALSLRLANEGARVAMNYLSRTDQAEQLKCGYLHHINQQRGSEQPHIEHWYQRLASSK